MGERSVRRLAVVLVVLGIVAAACGRSDSDGKAAPTTRSGGGATPSVACSSEALQATEIGVTASDITVEVMADTGSPLAPGLFQGNVDGMKAYAAYVNAHGGVGCRKLVVRAWDSHLDANESKNGLIDACGKAVAMVGGNALFNPDPAPMTGCVDEAGAATGLPDLAALAVDVNEMCAKGVFVIQSVSETCPIVPGVRPIEAMVGALRWWQQQYRGTDLHGLFLVPGDLPTTIQASTAIIDAMKLTGLRFDDIRKVSPRDAQTAYTPKVQSLKEHDSNFVYDGSNDTVMITMRKEARAQGSDSVKLWACSLSCYTNKFLVQGGSDVEGTYAWMQFLPFEEASANKELAAYVAGVGADKVDSFGAQAWQAGALFKQVVDEIVAADGPNAITRAKILERLAATKDFTANGWIGKKPLRGTSPCFMMVQVKGGKWTRVYPEKPGTFDCNDKNIVTVEVDPLAEAAKINQ